MIYEHCMILALARLFFLYSLHQVKRLVSLCWLFASFFLFFCVHSLFILCIYCVWYIYIDAWTVLATTRYESSLSLPYFPLIFFSHTFVFLTLKMLFIASCFSLLCMSVAHSCGTDSTRWDHIGSLFVSRVINVLSWAFGACFEYSLNESSHDTVHEHMHSRNRRQNAVSILCLFFFLSRINGSSVFIDKQMHILCIDNIHKLVQNRKRSNIPHRTVSTLILRNTGHRRIRSVDAPIPIATRRFLGDI